MLSMLKDDAGKRGQKKLNHPGVASSSLCSDFKIWIGILHTLPLVFLGFASLCVSLPEMPPLFATFLHSCFGVSDPRMIDELKRQNNAKDRHEEVREQI